MRARKAAADLRYAGLVGFAIVRGLRHGTVAPVPFNSRAVVILKIVVSALEFGGRRDSHRHHSGSGCGFERQRWPFRILLFLFFLFLLGLRGRLRRYRHTRPDEENGGAQHGGCERTGHASAILPPAIPKGKSA